MNGQLYKRCPRAIYLENYSYRHIMNTFMECRRMTIYPYPGGPGVQTFYAVEVFDFLENIIQETQNRHQADARKEQQKPQKKR